VGLRSDLECDFPCHDILTLCYAFLHQTEDTYYFFQEEGKQINY